MVVPIKSEDKVKRGPIIVFGVIAASLIGLGIVLLEPYYRTDASLLFVLLMGFTAGIIILSPLVFPYGKFTDDVTGGKESTTLIGINATVIVGALFFLQIVPGSGFENSTNGNLTSISIYELRELDSSQARVLLANLTSLTIIPFAFSAVVIAIWGNHPFWSKKYKVTTLSGGFIWRKQDISLNPRQVTGTKLGTTLMIGGFIWLIITMVMLVYITR